MSRLLAVAVAILVSPAWAEWERLPAPTDHSFNAVACVQELVEAVWERRYAEAWTNAPLFTGVVVRTTDEAVPAVVGNLTNWSYETEVVIITNAVTIETMSSALEWVDAYLDISRFSRWRDAEQAEEIDDVLADGETTNWCWNGSTWLQTSTNWRSNIATYWPIGENYVSPVLYDPLLYAYPLKQAGKGVDLTYIISVVTNANPSDPGWMSGSYGSETAPNPRVVTNSVIWWEPTLMPERAFPSNGLILVRFVYQPAPAFNAGVAFYPTSVFVWATGDVGRGTYIFDGFAEVEAFDGTIDAPIYNCSTCGGYSVHLYHEKFYGGYVWSLRQGEDVVAEQYYGTVKAYSRGGALYVYDAAGIGSNVTISCPSMSESNWWVETCWVQQDVSALVDATSFIPYSNMVPPAWRAHTGSTNWGDFLPFTVSAAVTVVHGPPLVVATNGATNIYLRTHATNVWEFGPDGQGTAQTQAVVNAVTWDNYNHYLDKGWTKALTNAAPRVSFISDKSHWGDEISLVWTQRTAIFGRYISESPYQWGRTLGRRVVWPDALNDRWEILRRLRWRMGSAGFVRETASATKTDDCCGLIDEVPEVCSYGTAAGLYGGLAPLFATNGVAGVLSSGGSVGGYMRVLGHMHAEDPHAYTVESSASVSLERGKPYAEVAGIVTAATVRFFRLVEDPRSYDGCPPEETTKAGEVCSGALWDEGTAGRYIAHDEVSSAAGELVASNTWGIVSETLTSANAAKPAGLASCWDEPEWWWEYEVDVNFEFISICGEEDLNVTHSGALGFNSRSGATRGLYLMDMQFYRGDP
jgi:hypothetical protein